MEKTGMEKKLELALNNIFSDYFTDAVAEKLAPLTNSQRNEALNSVKSDSMVEVKAMIFVWPVESLKQI